MLPVAPVCSDGNPDADNFTRQMHTLEACLLLLIHFAKAVPISLGAAETLKETSRGEPSPFIISLLC